MLPRRTSPIKRWISSTMPLQLCRTRRCCRRLPPICLRRLGAKRSLFRAMTKVSPLRAQACALLGLRKTCPRDSRALVGVDTSVAEHNTHTRSLSSSPTAYTLSHRADKRPQVSLSKTRTHARARAHTHTSLSFVFTRCIHTHKPSRRLAVTSVTVRSSTGSGSWS